MPTIVVHSPAHVAVDGIDAGSVVDVLANYPADRFPGIRGEVLAGLSAWGDALRQAHEDDCRAICERHAADTVAARAVAEGRIAQLATSHAEAIAQIEAGKTAALAERDEEVARLRAEIAEKDAMIKALGGTELAQKLRREAQVKAAQEALAKAQADLESLQSAAS